RTSFLFIFLRRSPYVTFSSTVIHGNKPPSWKTTTRSVPGPVIVLPFSSTSPEVGVSRPAISFNTVDLPQPDGPINDTNRSEEHTSELQSRFDLVCRLLLAHK